MRVANLRFGPENGLVMKKSIKNASSRLMGGEFLNQSNVFSPVQKVT